ncbi:hypothetical protein EUTSA_v10014488mg [Eutrema salsugineum]|uniref:TF-B3 domain-containing protein n=1 Tax=Eutrema salsugineum TaxID=72664 RepID=V4N989_EUTSA|nr:B3 domain-containing protein At5g60130 [Eutrema salsugineum]ESQ42331.1 hypothetical protein EUTSA_v10014488mg [Eutrema salsugineum]
MNQGHNADYCLPKFFKVYLAGISGDDMEVPVSFNRCLPKCLPNNVTIKSIYGKIWKMALRKCGEKYVLVNGWKMIVKDEDLVGGDVLEFDFDGSQCFNFCIYEPRTMCKRLRRSSVRGEEETRANDDNDATLEDVDVSDQRQYLDDPNNPFFPVTLNPNRRSQLRIPRKVITDYGLNFPENITLVDTLVKKFGKLAKKIKIQLNGSVFVKGYGAILRRNNVKSRDKLICELKKTGSNNMVHTIKFHVISE